MTCINHIALLVPSVEKAASLFRARDLCVLPTQIFPAEGTKEIYVGRSEQNFRILLVEAIAEGPYQRALTKRGYGLHHIAVETDDKAAYVKAAAALGWNLHPQSQEPWLYKKGAPFLVELGDLHEKKSSLLSRLEIAGAQVDTFASELQIAEFVTAGDRTRLQVGEHSFGLEELL